MAEMDAVGIVDEPDHGVGSAKPQPTQTSRFRKAIAPSDQHPDHRTCGLSLVYCDRSGVESLRQFNHDVVDDRDFHRLRSPCAAGSR